MSACTEHTHSLFAPCVNGLYLNEYLRRPSARPRRGGKSVPYAEVDGIPVCVLGSGEWCERERGHSGPHVLKGAPTRV